jgi:hypothetical protein
MKPEEMTLNWPVRLLKKIMAFLKAMRNRSKEAMMFVDEAPSEFKDGADSRASTKPGTEVKKTTPE